MIKSFKTPTLEELSIQLQKLEEYVRQNDLLFKRQLKALQQLISQVHGELSSKTNRR